MSNITTAVDEIFTLFKNAWDLSSAQYNNNVIPTVLWQGVDKEIDPDVTESWARIFITHTGGDQATLSNEDGKRKFERRGSVAVQIYFPIIRGIGMHNLYKLAEVALKAFEGKTTDSGVLFKNLRFAEAGRFDAWLQVNVIGQFSYDEVH